MEAKKIQAFYSKISGVESVFSVDSLCGVKMMYNCIHFEVKGRIGIVTMLHGTMQNDFPDEMLAVLAQIEEDAEIRAVILKNDGKFFCAGGDLSGGVKRDQMGAKAYIAKAGRMAQRLTSCSKPIIALVNGAAAGGGANLALSCDFVLASEKAKFREVFVNINYIPDTGGLWNLVRLVGPMRAKELCLTGKVIGAQQAYDMGLLTSLVPSETLLEKGLELAEELSFKPPQAVKFIKEICCRIPEMTHEGYLDYESSVMALLWATQDHEEGVLAFKEKRAPEFTGK